MHSASPPPAARLARARCPRSPQTKTNKSARAQWAPGVDRWLAPAAIFITVTLLSVAVCTAQQEPHLWRTRRQLVSDEPPPTTTTTTTTTAAAATTTATTSSPAPPTAAAVAETTSGSGATTDREQAAGPHAKTKVPPVNFTQVDEMFDAVFSEAEVVQKWRKMDKTLTDGVRSILKMIFPPLVAMSTDAKVSGNCSGAILKWILNLRNLRTWAVQMLDSIGKPSAGILEGSLTMFGNYKQCLGVRAPDEDEIEVSDDGEFKEYFRGQYCVVQVRPPLAKKPAFYSLNSTITSLLRKSYKYYERTVYDDLSELAMAFHFVSIRLDLCVPSLCSRDDIQRVANFLASKVDFRARVQRCDTEPTQAHALVDSSHLLWSMIFIILLLLVLVSTLTSVAFRLSKRAKKSKTKSIFTSMSVYRSLSHMRNVQLDRISDSKPVFLYSLRFIVVLWIFLVSLASQLDYQYLRELLSLRDIIMLWPMQLVVNSSLAFESLILLTAFTYSYQNINANLTDLVKYNLSKYFRLMPSIMLLVAITIITPLLYPNRSPVWHDFVDEPAQVCKSNGFINLFFLQNMLDSRQICLPQTWLFCVELQLCVLAIPLVYMMNRQFESSQGRFRPSSGPMATLIVIALAGCVANFVNIYRHSLPAAWFLTFPDKDDKHLYFTLHLYRTWTHVTTFAVGLFTGHLCRCLALETFSGRLCGRKCSGCLIWTLVLALMGVLIYSTHSWSVDGVAHLEAPIASALYAALAPLLWSFSWSLILFQLTVPSDKSHCSALAQLLAGDVNLVRIGRLSFVAYLINPYVNSFVLAVQEQSIFSSILMLGHTLVGNIVITFALSFHVSALVELPCRRLFKKLLLGSRRHSTNLDIISRQLNMRQHNSGLTRDSQQKQTHGAAGAQRSQSSVMIPLK